MRHVRSATVRWVIALAVGFSVGLLGCSSKPRAGDIAPSAEADRSPLASILKPRQAKAELRILTPPIDVRETAEKIKATARSNPALFAELFKKQDAAGVVLYDPRMGVTQEAYERFKRLPELSTLAIAQEFELVIARSSPDKVLLTGLPQIPKLEIDLAKQTVESPFGKLDAADPFEPNDRQVLTGPIHGVNWRIQSLDSMAGDEFKLAKTTVAEQTETGDLWLVLEVRNYVQGTHLVDYWVRVPKSK
jgi:hypothetical protein